MNSFRVLLLMVTFVLNACASSTPEATKHVYAEARTRTYSEKVSEYVRPLVIYPDATQISGNPAAQFAVSLQPDGRITAVQLAKSSGYPAWDMAARKALIRAEKIPADENTTVPPQLLLTMRPKL